MVHAIGTPPAHADPKPVMVHYMPWYVSKSYSGYWGWHWTMNHYNPDTVDGTGRREIASWHYPLIGPYDSLDPAVLEYHVLLMKLAGIDGVIVDWYGKDNYLDYGVNNQRTLALLGYVRKAGLKFSLCYEDQTIQHEIDGNYINASAAMTQAQQTMRYAETNYFTDASYLRLNGSPVYLNFGPQYFKTDSQWVSIFSVLNASNQPAFFTLDNRYAAGAGAFDWPPMWLSGGGTLTTHQLNTYLNSFDAQGAGWPAFVSSAFPRFRDIYQQAGVGSSYGTLDDRNGQTFLETLRRAVTNGSDLIQVVTWNDHGEGTVIEPTLEFGYRDLGVIQDFRRQYWDASFPYHTNDLAVALRLYNLRKQYVNNAAMNAELNRVFTNIVASKLENALLQLDGIESAKPVIYDLSSSNGQFQFSIGGYVASGVQVQMSTNLANTNWQTLTTIPAGTVLPTFSGYFTQSLSSFFRVQ